jgi:hypothetical protein
MIISTYSKFLQQQKHQFESQNIMAQNLSQNIVEERDKLVKKISYIVSSASEAGVQIQIDSDDVDFGKPRVKVLINGNEYTFTLEGKMIQIQSSDGGVLDNFKGTSKQIVDKIISHNF